MGSEAGRADGGDASGVAMAGGEEVVCLCVCGCIGGEFEVCQAGNVVLVVGWMTDVGSVDPAFKPRSLAIDGFTDLQYIKSRVHVTFRR